MSRFKDAYIEGLNDQINMFNDESLEETLLCFWGHLKKVVLEYNIDLSPGTHLYYLLTDIVSVLLNKYTAGYADCSFGYVKGLFYVTLSGNLIDSPVSYLEEELDAKSDYSVRKQNIKFERLILIDMEEKKCLK